MNKNLKAAAEAFIKKHNGISRDNIEVTSVEIVVDQGDGCNCCGDSATADLDIDYKCDLVRPNGDIVFGHRDLWSYDSDDLEVENFFNFLADWKPSA